jgi:hypothetical protein
MGTDEELEQRQVVCSRCFQITPESLIHVIPHFNDDAKAYVTTYRCETCWLPALNETRTRLVKTEDWAEILSLIDCLERHGIFLFEFRRGDPLPAVRALLEPTIELMGLGTIRMSVGPLQPATEVEALIADMNKNERLAEAAYQAMYDAGPSVAKDCLDDVRGLFARAIDLARRAALADEVARLTARCDYIVGVYDSQFRGIG